MGPVDALLSRITTYGRLQSATTKNKAFFWAKKQKRKLATGDQVRVRITAVSLGRAGSSGKIGVTARQPFLGKLDWLKEDVIPGKSSA